jgi:hypothetical protein
MLNILVAPVADLCTIHKEIVVSQRVSCMCSASRMLLRSCLHKQLHSAVSSSTTTKRPQLINAISKSVEPYSNSGLAALRVGDLEVLPDCGSAPHRTNQILGGISTDSCIVAARTGMCVSFCSRMKCVVCM